MCTPQQTVKGSSVPARKLGEKLSPNLVVSSWYRRTLYRSCNSQLRSPTSDYVYPWTHAPCTVDGTFLLGEAKPIVT